ncbi:hypothetical protein FRC17_001138 [Serendipita sp. 399]|nr:hypothetical protein FRC17_001138 [Serendipita sp. 399]
MDDEEIRQEFLTSVDKFIAALQGDDEALAAFHTFWKDLNERLLAAPRSCGVYEAADEAALAIAAAAESFIAVEETIKAENDKLCEEAQILCSNLQKLDLLAPNEDDGPTDEEIEQDWTTLRDWLLSNIGSPFLPDAPLNAPSPCETMDLDEFSHWIQVIISRSSWQFVYEKYAADNIHRMKKLCQRFLPPLLLETVKKGDKFPKTKDTIRLAFFDMCSSVVKAWTDIGDERRNPADWLKEAESRIAMLPTDEELEALGWDDEWLEFDWDALETLRRNSAILLERKTNIDGTASPATVGSYASPAHPSEVSVKDALGCSIGTKRKFSEMVALSISSSSPICTPSDSDSIETVKHRPSKKLRTTGEPLSSSENLATPLVKSCSASLMVGSSATLSPRSPASPGSPESLSGSDSGSESGSPYAQSSPCSDSSPSPPGPSEDDKAIVTSTRRLPLTSLKSITSQSSEVDISAPVQGVAPSSDASVPTAPNNQTTSEINQHQQICVKVELVESQVQIDAVHDSTASKPPQPQIHIERKRKREDVDGATPVNLPSWEQSTGQYDDASSPTYHPPISKTRRWRLGRCPTLSSDSSASRKGQSEDNVHSSRRPEATSFDDQRPAKRVALDRRYSSTTAIT